MNTETSPPESESTAIVPIEQMNTIEKFTDKKLVDQILEAHAYVPDTTTKKGRDEIASFAHKFRKSKVAFDNRGKLLTEEATTMINAVNAERKRARETFDRQAVDARKPLTDWEDEKQAKEDRIRNLITLMGSYLPKAGTDLSSTHMKLELEALEKIEIGEHYGNLETEAHRTKDATIVSLKDLIDKQEKAEKDAAELDRLQNEEKERERVQVINTQIEGMSMYVEGVLSRARDEEDIARKIFIIAEAIIKLEDKRIDQGVFAELVDKAEVARAKAIFVLNTQLVNLQKDKSRIETEAENERLKTEKAENAETAIIVIKKRIHAMKAITNDPEYSDSWVAGPLASDEILKRISVIDDVEIDESFGEYIDEATKTKVESASKLEVMLKEAFEHEEKKKNKDAEDEADRIQEGIDADNTEKAKEKLDREADEANRKKVHSEIEEDCTKVQGSFATALIEGKIRHIEINY